MKLNDLRGAISSRDGETIAPRVGSPLSYVEGRVRGSATPSDASALLAPMLKAMGWSPSESSIELSELIDAPTLILRTGEFRQAIRPSWDDGYWLFAIPNAPCRVVGVDYGGASGKTVAVTAVKHSDGTIAVDGVAEFSNVARDELRREVHNWAESVGVSTLLTRFSEDDLATMSIQASRNFNRRVELGPFVDAAALEEFAAAVGLALSEVQKMFLQLVSAVENSPGIAAMASALKKLNVRHGTSVKIKPFSGRRRRLSAATLPKSWMDRFDVVQFDFGVEESIGYDARPGDVIFFTANRPRDHPGGSAGDPPFGVLLSRERVTDEVECIAFVPVFRGLTA